MLLKKEKDVDQYLENWPSQYYDMIDPKMRRDVLQKAMQQELDPVGDKYRYKLLQRRYDKAMKADTFMYAWMMIRVAASNSSINFLNQKKQAYELRQNMDQLLLLDFVPENEQEQAVLEEEWTQFAGVYISSCVGSKTYCSTMLGFIPIADEAVAQKIADEIDLITEKYPAKLGMAAAFVPLRSIFKKVYAEMITGEGNE